MDNSGNYISREAALDAISEWLMKALHQENMSSYNDGERAAYRTAMSEIAELPAADVVPLDYHERCLQIDVKNRLALERNIPRWIPVTERKPKTDDLVIVAIHDDSGDTPYDVTNVGFYLDVFPLGIWVVENERCNYVTHWMPPPSPPKEE